MIYFISDPTKKINHTNFIVSFSGVHGDSTVKKGREGINILNFKGDIDTLLPYATDVISSIEIVNQGINDLYLHNMKLKLQI